MSPRPIRRTQAIVPFGVGAMIDFPGPLSLIHCGLDAWPFREDDPEHREFRIDDEKRLAEQLGVKYFVIPPDFRYPRHGDDTQQPNLGLRLPFLRFPLWHVCPRCGLMYESALHDVPAPVCTGPVATGIGRGGPHSRRRTYQVRFVAACARGHLQDFPWWEWISRCATPDRQGRLRMKTTGSASLGGVTIVCEESLPNDIVEVGRRTLAGAFDLEPDETSALSKIGVLCTGHNPALGIPSATTPAPGCGNHLHPLLRGASNIYFPRVASAIFLPPVDEHASNDILEVLEDPLVWQFINLIASASGGVFPLKSAEVVLAEYYPGRGLDPQGLADAANRKLESLKSPKTRPGQIPGDTREQAFRRDEYNLFSRDVQEGYPRTNLLVRTQDLTDFAPFVSRHFERVALIHKLRETRAFVGFSRIYPGNDLTEADARALISRTPRDWLPGIVVRGEGIFLQLRESAIRSWLATHHEAVDRRTTLMQRTIDQFHEKRHQEQLIISPRFVLLHTLAHVVINELVLKSGYGSASLRERLYCSDDDERPMAGVLIYTAAGDSEGTMGGLVRMGRPGRLENVLLQAIEKARWCSTDPVCIESAGQGPDSCNLAACHSCALLPETACEVQNRLLDRGLVVGTLTEHKIGFFAAVSSVP